MADFLNVFFWIWISFHNIYVMPFLIIDPDSQIHSRLVHCILRIAHRQFALRSPTMVLSRNASLSIVNDFIERFHGTVVLKIEDYNPLPKQVVIFIETAKDFFMILKDFKPNLKAKDLLDTTALFIIVLSDSKDIARVCDGMWNLYASNVVILTHHDIDNVALYTYYPYRQGYPCDDTTPVLITYCNDTFGTPWISNLYSEKMKSLHGCPLFISSAKTYHPPANAKIPIEQVKNQIIDLLREILDFTPINVVAEYVKVESYSSTNWTGSLGDVLYGRANISVASAVLSPELARVLDYSSPYYQLDLSWVASPVSSAPANWRLLAPLSYNLWIALVTTVSLVFCLPLTVKIPRLKNFCYKYFKNLKYVDGFVFRTWGAMLGQPVRVNPRKFRDFYIVSLWVWFTFTLRSAYQSSLIGALKSESLHGKFGSLEEAVAVGYKYGGRLSDFDHFDREPDVAESFVVIPDMEFDTLFDSISRGQARFVTPASLEYVWARCDGRALRDCVHVIPGSILTLPMVLYLRRWSPLTRAVNTWLVRCYESGLLSPHSPSASSPAAALQALPSVPEPLTLQQVTGCFFCLVGGSFCSLCIFVIELVVFKWNNQSALL